MDMLQLAVRKVFVLKVIHLGFTCYYDGYLHKNKLFVHIYDETADLYLLLSSANVVAGILVWCLHEFPKRSIECPSSYEFVPLNSDTAGDKHIIFVVG